VIFSASLLVQMVRLGLLLRSIAKDGNKKRRKRFRVFLFVFCVDWEKKK